MCTMLKNPKTRYAALGSCVFFLFGMILCIIGGRLILYQQVLSTQGREVIAIITKTGSVRRSAGGYVSFIKYRFEDTAGDVHTGQSSGYSGEVGETLRIEYAPFFPFIHRVAGEEKNTGYRWRWGIFAAGLLFAMAGFHWFMNTLKRFRLGKRLLKEGTICIGSVKKLADGGRTIIYEYAAAAGFFQGKTLALPLTLVKQYKENDPIEVLIDRSNPAVSVLKVEL